MVIERRGGDIQAVSRQATGSTNASGRWPADDLLLNGRPYFVAGAGGMGPSTMTAGAMPSSFTRSRQGAGPTWSRG